MAARNRHGRRNFLRYTVYNPVSFLRQVVGWALILLFGPAPLAPLLAFSSRPAACCARKTGASCCNRHRKPGGPGLEATPACQPGCGQAAVEPSAPLQGLFFPAKAIGAPLTMSGRLQLISPPALPSTGSPILYQRPPPLLSA